MMDDSLFSAIRQGDLAGVDAAIGGGADVNSAGDQPPIHYAIEHQMVEIVRRLIAAGAAVNRDAGDGWTPLVHAIDIESDSAWQAHHETGHESTAMTELLLAAGAVPIERAFGVAEGYENRKALELLRRCVSRP
jgi:hypothetical protein